MDPALLILDLDETLVYGTEQPLSRPADFGVGPYHVYLRPHVGPFLIAVANWFKLAVWTSAGEGYAARVVDHLFPPPSHLEFFWSNAKCTQHFNPETGTSDSLKNLQKVKRRLGFPLERILAIDDSPEKLSRNFGNHIRVKPFLGDEADTELRDLLPFLDWIRSIENFRRVEKRGWKTRPVGQSA